MVTTIYDYVNEIQTKFPMFSKKEIELILFRGFRMLDELARCGYSVNIYSRQTTPSTLAFIGDSINKDSDHYLRKILRKVKRLARLAKAQFDGYYYFTITDEQNKEVLKQGETKTFKNIILFKYRIMASELGLGHVWKIPKEEDSTFRRMNELITDSAIYVDGKHN